MGVVLAVEMCRILAPGTWDRDGPKNGTTPVLIPGQVPGTVTALVRGLHVQVDQN